MYYWNRAKEDDNKKSLGKLIKSIDVPFADNTAIVHISGNRDDNGKILKTNQGLSKLFGYTKTEVVGHSVNILMPSLFAKHHNIFLERFYKTDRKSVV